MSVRFHTSVLLDEVVEGLCIEKGEKYIDATVGGGGHAWEIVKRGGQVLGIDQDKKAIVEAGLFLNTKSKSVKNKGKWKLIHGNFANIAKIAKTEGFSNISGILFDLGVSTYQIKQSGRGFSFLLDEDLDMRMSFGEQTAVGRTAKDIVNGSSGEELQEIFARFGEEENAGAISDAIIAHRSINKITKTIQLRSIIYSIYKKNRVKSRIDPATKVFQALRIVVNREIENLKVALPQATSLLKKRGRILVISFHSLEDRVVKQMFRKSSEIKILTKSPIRPKAKEVKSNSSARSASLRIAEKI